MKHTDRLISKQKRHFFIIFFPSFTGGPYISSGSSEELPTLPLCVPHCGCYHRADVNGLQLPRSTATPAPNYCHWLSITERWQAARAKQKNNQNCVLEGNLNKLAKREAGARGHNARGGRSGWKAPLPRTVQPICQSICHFSLPPCDCNLKLINKLGTMNISKKKKKS